MSQQLFGDPLVGNTPIGTREPLWNAQPLEPSLIYFASRRERTGGGNRQFAGAQLGPRLGQRSGSCGHRHRTGETPDLWLGGLYQRSALSRQAGLRVQESDPGSVAVALATEGFLVGEPGQPSQMTPVGAGQVASISEGQLS